MHRKRSYSPFALSLFVIPGHLHIRVCTVLVLFARQRCTGLGECRPQPVEKLLLLAFIDDGDVVDDEDIIESVERGDGVPEEEGISKMSSRRNLPRVCNRRSRRSYKDRVCFESEDTAHSMREELQMLTSYITPPSDLRQRRAHPGV